MPELKPCPFCGEKAEIMEYSDRFQCGCKDEDCIAWVEEMPVYLTRSGAIKDWNTRAYEERKTCRNLSQYPECYRGDEVYDCSMCCACDSFECSECGMKIPDFRYFQDGAYIIGTSVRFCPLCGAKVSYSANE